MTGTEERNEDPHPATRAEEYAKFDEPKPQTPSMPDADATDGHDPKPQLEVQPVPSDIRSLATDYDAFAVVDDEEEEEDDFAELCCDAACDGGVPMHFAINEDDDDSVDALIAVTDGLIAESSKLLEDDDFVLEDEDLEPVDETSPVAAVERTAEEIGPKNIVLLVVGTRGDLQPFAGIGLQLKAKGHRVRIASHDIYRKWVTDCGLEFYPLGGDPKVLSEFVVKHRGVNPGLNVDDAFAQRKQVRAIVESTWPACTEPDPGPEPGVSPPGPPFRAHIIVSNPPSYGHIHCAEKLQIPLHVVFTMPWSPTQAFAQPFARVTGTSTRAKNHGLLTSKMNWMSYFAMDDLTWLGLRDIIKAFRRKTLGLKRFTKYTGSHGMFHSKVPFTYIWSPSLVPRPSDWPSYVEVVGFVTTNVDSVVQFTPPADLVAFLEAGSPPLYIGFGSLVVGNPKELTAQAVAAIQATGVRAIIQKGWGGLGEGLEGDSLPSNIFVLQTGVAHDWLFPHCSAVVHHGGAGTTSTGLYAAKPTFIVSFFGDQPFWGAACESAKVGPQSVPITSFTTKKLIEAIRFMLQPSCQAAAARIAEKMKAEDGAAGAAEHILRTIHHSQQPGYRLRYVRKRDQGVVAAAAEDDLEDGDDDDDDEDLEDDVQEANVGSSPVKLIRMRSSIQHRTKSTISHGKAITKSLGFAVVGSGRSISKSAGRVLTTSSSSVGSALSRSSHVVGRTVSGTRGVLNATGGAAASVVGKGAGAMGSVVSFTGRAAGRALMEGFKMTLGRRSRKDTKEDKGDTEEKEAEEKAEKEDNADKEDKEEKADKEEEK